MRLLLDTHTFIWMDIAPTRISNNVTSALENTQNDLYLSLVSVWEMQIKIQLNKLELNLSLEETLFSQQQTNAVQILPIQLSH